MNNELNKVEKTHNFHIAFLSLYIAENYGIRILSRILRNNGFKVTEIYFKDWINNYLAKPNHREIKELIELLKQRNPDILGISVRASAFHELAKEFTRIIKRNLNVPVLWGGLHVSSMPEECIKVADMICIGEAEEAMLELALGCSAGKDITKIKNIWVRNNGKIVKNFPRALEENLDNVPFRDFHTQQDKFYINNKVFRGDPCLKDRTYLITATRGCPFSSCSYCHNSYLNKLYDEYGGYGYRYRSYENVIEELKYAKKVFKKLKNIRFDDEVFVTNKEWIERFCELYKKEIKLPFSVILHPLVVKEELLSKLVKTGLKEVEIGIQNTERINKILYNRNVTDKQVVKAAKIINKFNIEADYHLLLDDPISKSEDKENLFKLINCLPTPFNLYLCSLTLFPGTDLVKQLMDKKLIQTKDIEHKSKKVFSQYRVDLNYSRKKEDVFWISLLMLVNKRIVPEKFINSIKKSIFFKKHPLLIKIFAQLVNFFSINYVFLKILIRGDVDRRLVKRWANFRSIITQ